MCVIPVRIVFFEVEVYTTQVSVRLGGGTKKSALKGCLCPARVLIYDADNLLFCARGGLVFCCGEIILTAVKINP